MLVADILRQKGDTVITVAEDARVSEALRLLAEHRIGAVLVTAAGGDVRGILSERDIARALHERGADMLALAVADLMTTNVVGCTPNDEVCDLLGTMTTKRFRHMPVLADGRLAGVISIGDVVKARIDEAVAEAAALREYITH